MSPSGTCNRIFRGAELQRRRFKRLPGALALKIGRPHAAASRDGGFMVM
jgi:hypothetical protein